MQYRHFENALIGMLGIEEAELGAFRARLRHLRKLGVPNVPRRGSGNTAIYQKVDLFSTFIALALQTLGSNPTVSALITGFATRRVELIETHKTELFLIVTNIPDVSPESLNTVPEPPVGTVAFAYINTSASARVLACIVSGADRAGKFATQSNLIACAVINLSARYRALPNET
jgi:hypothetical protein